MPFNLLDWRWREAGVIAAIEARAASHRPCPQRLPARHSGGGRSGGVAARSKAWIAQELRPPDREISPATSAATSAADLCLAYARGQGWIDGVVIGMETEDAARDQSASLRCGRRCRAKPAREIEALMPRVPEQLLDPAQWPQKHDTTAPTLFRLDGRTAFVSGAAGHLGSRHGARAVRSGRACDPQRPRRFRAQGFRRRAEGRRPFGLRAPPSMSPISRRVRAFFAGARAPRRPGQQRDLA